MHCPSEPPALHGVGLRAIAWVGFAIALAGQVYALYFAHGPGHLPFWQADKLVHFGVFGAVAFTGVVVGIPWRWLLLGLVVHAGASEAIQGLALGRDASGFDSLADIAGTLAGLAVASALPFRRRVHDRGEKVSPGSRFSPR